MHLEIERRYNLTDHDYAIIQGFHLELKEELTDYYLDDRNFTLFKNDYHLRMRNGRYELKIDHYNPKTQSSSCEEYYNEDEIEDKLSPFGLTIEDTKGVIVVETKREKYTTSYKGYSIILDVDIFQYGKRYEIEVYLENFTGDKKSEEEKVNIIFDEFIHEYNLQANSDNVVLKGITCAMHQNIALFEILNEKS